MKKIKEKINNTKTKPCPHCGTKYLVNTGYCVKCKKKVDNKSEKLGGEPFPDRLHVDQGENQKDIKPNENGFYNDVQFKQRYQPNKVQQQDEVDKLDNEDNTGVLKIENIQDFLKSVTEFIENNK